MEYTLVLAKEEMMKMMAAVALVVALTATVGVASPDSYTFGCYWGNSNCGVPGVPRNVVAEPDTRAACVSWGKAHVSECI